MPKYYFCFIVLLASFILNNMGNRGEQVEAIRPPKPQVEAIRPPRPINKPTKTTEI